MRNSSILLTEIFPYLEPGAPMPSGRDLAHILTQLEDSEVEEGGPYAPLDIGLNMVVALFLRLHGVHLPKLDTFIQKELEAEGVVSALFDTAALATLIERYRSADESEEDIDGFPTWSEEELRIITNVHKELDWKIASLPKPFMREARQVAERTIMGNPDKQMTLMPLYLRQALGKKGRRFSDGHLGELGLANVFFWAAFIIYDDFWDEDEAAEPKYLPVANLFARQYTRYFSTFSPGTGIERIFHRYMDKLDAANAWEIQNCRMKRNGNQVLIPSKLPPYRDFRIKFYPAAGHVIGPVSMLLELGYGEWSEEVQHLIKYFRHYLIAMQLNDDAHDWKEDLKRGHISTAVSFLLQAWEQPHAGSASIDLQQDMQKLERIFWFDALPKICTAIFEHTDKAQRALDSLTCIEDPAPLQRFIDRNRRAAETAQTEQHQSIEFLKALENKAQK